MKKLLLFLIIILISANAYSICLFNCTEEPKLEGPVLEELSIEEEIAPPVVKKCFYAMIGRNGHYAVMEAEQIECTGIRVIGKVSGNKIIEYDTNMIESNTQTPRDREIFDKKIESLWPNLQIIKTSP